jgi:signal transduction histidine kinase
MSHELRTPLNAVIGFTEVLLERYFGEINAKQEDYLRDVLSSGQHLLSLINDILDLAKVEAGRMELDLATFALGPVLEAGLVMVRERASRGGVQLSLDAPDDLGRIEADERKVKQVLFNLLTNAVKFTPAGGRVDVAARRENGHVRLAVSDTGLGIAPADQARIFEEFGQAEGGRRQSEGTGLGLALSKRFVELHGGAIQVESAPGVGSTFSVTLPVQQTAPGRD